jgi:hypothetical protein
MPEEEQNKLYVMEKGNQQHVDDSFRPGQIWQLS